MLKKILTGTGIAVSLTGMFLLGSMVLGPVFAQTPAATAQTQAIASSTGNSTAEETIQATDPDNVQEQVGDQNQVDTPGLQETGADAAPEQSSDKTDAAAGTAAVTAAQAAEAALAANPGTTVVKTTLDNENGMLIYSVELSNGTDVKVDAGTAAILHTEAVGQDSQAEAPETSGG